MSVVFRIRCNVCANVYIVKPVFKENGYQVSLEKCGLCGSGDVHYLKEEIGDSDYNG
jgi:hypothetical protein